MNIIRRYLEKRRINQRERFIHRIKSNLSYMNSEDNNGLLRARLWRMPGITYMDTSSGWSSYVTVRMDDGYEITRSGSFSTDALRNAAYSVAKRLLEVRGIDSSCLEQSGD